MKNFYVYAYIRSNASATAKEGTPYYIGKGIGNRAFIKHSCPAPKDTANIVFIKEQLTESEAHQLEIQLISQYGRKDLGTGILHNRTNGGEGISNPSANTRNKMASAKRSESPETRLKRSISAKNRVRQPCSEETKRKISEANRGMKRTAEVKEKQSVAKKDIRLTNEHKTKISKALAGKPKSPLSDQHKEKIGKARRGKPWTAARRAAYENKENQNSKN